MGSKRATALMAILLFLILGYVSKPIWEPYVMGLQAQGTQPPLPGLNSVSGLEVHQDAKGRWIANFDYFYTGDPQHVWLRSTLVRGSDITAIEMSRLDTGGFSVPHLERGAHHINIEIIRPPTIQQSITTSQVVVDMLVLNREDPQTLSSLSAQAKSPYKIIASQHIKQVIDWPDMQTWFYDRQFADKTPEDILKEAVAQIDAGDEGSIAQAKHSLERLISKDPKFDAAYVELARIAMKSNWGQEGLHQAEALIHSALQIRPDSVNAKILLGYVYAHQKRYKVAESLFAEAASTDTKNLWLWANWGEVLVMQGKIDKGIEKYRVAISKPRPNDTYDRARLDAYWHLIALLDKRNELDGEEALHKQRADEYGAGNCYFSDYARFMLQQRGDAAQAISIARKAVDGHCSNPAAREVLGLAYYSAWATAPTDRRAELLNQARVFLPIGPRPLYLLASSEQTVDAVKKLVGAGESVDQSDNNKLNALAYAVQTRNYEIASRLVRFGARTDALIGPDQMPVALIPVIEGDFSGIRFMKKTGVDYSKLQFQGRSVLDQVRQSGDRKLIEALNPEASAL